MDKLTYKERKERGLCTRCGQPLPDRWGYVQCGKCRLYMGQKQKERYARNAKIREEVKAIEAKEKAKKEAAEKKKKEESATLDEMTVDAKNHGMTYAELQRAELIRKMREQKDF